MLNTILLYLGAALLAVLSGCCAHHPEMPPMTDLKQI